MPATLVVFDGTVRTGCGAASAAVGPFYCALDRRVYLDTGFFRQLAVEFRAPGDFAQAYVISHEMGHHVQNVTGVFSQVQAATAADPELANELSIRTELQADCLAGVWGHSTYERDMLERGDLEEALRAAAAVGDDRIQRGRPAGSIPRPGPTARPSSAARGGCAATRPAILTPATPSPATSEPRAVTQRVDDGLLGVHAIGRLATQVRSLTESRCGGHAIDCSDRPPGRGAKAALGRREARPNPPRDPKRLKGSEEMEIGLLVLRIVVAAAARVRAPETTRPRAAGA